ncbi:MAG TPA: hypothetical protein VMY35_04565 [Phycisphaerae bacterium]|nr:hypothetical protein [Phycisphaerae bacterium]
MANKIDTAIDAIETELKKLVEADGTGVLKAVVRRIINPLKETNLPICGLVPSEVVRHGGLGATADWQIPVLLMVCTRSKDVEGDATITEIIAEIQAKLDALIASAAPGVAFDLPRWDIWYRPGLTDVPVGAWGSLRISITGTLKTA